MPDSHPNPEITKTVRDYFTEFFSKEGWQVASIMTLSAALLELKTELKGIREELTKHNQRHE